MSIRKDIFNEPFDEGTLTKLSIYESYLKDWLPVFLAKNEIIWKNIQVFDFCAGQGKDINGVHGSPLITINAINKWSENINHKNLNVRLILNEPNKKYYSHLLEVIKSEIKPKVYQTEHFQKTFDELFEKEYDSMKKSANLLFIDQNGIKIITKEVFKKIIDLQSTDFLFFISSSFLKRFGGSKEFQNYLEIDKNDIDKNKYYHIHKTIYNFYKNLIPKGKEYFLAPFSIKKGSNIYGLIYGTNHTLGIEKFLSICWKKDEQRGEANFDIDEENINPNMPRLFAEYNIPTKIQVFENDLENKILKKEITTNKSMYLYSLSNGFLPKHANKKINEMKSEKKIGFEFITISNNIHKITKSEPILTL